MNGNKSCKIRDIRFWSVLRKTGYDILLISLLMMWIPSECRCETGTVSSPHIVVQYEDIGERYARLVSESAEQSFRVITAELGHVPEKPLTIILTGTDEEFSKATEGVLPDWSAAAAMPGNRIVVSPLPGLKMEIERILAHEIVHCVIYDAAGGTFVPRWFHEGCAEALSGEWGIRGRLYMVWKVSRGELMSFRDIEDVFSARGADVTLAYDQSLLAVNRLGTLRGPSVVPLILGNLSRGYEFDRAFFEASGLTTAEFERDYLDSVRRAYGKRMLLTYIPGTWTIILLLSFFVYIIKRRRNKRLMSQWEVVDAAENIIRFRPGPPSEE
ncbi:hypothetical protein LLG96_16240 [bacterium]|nr:hypothetical protein [bacterium]